MLFLKKVSQTIKELRAESQSWPEKARLSVEKNRIAKRFNHLNSLRQSNGFLQFKSIEEFSSYFRIKEIEYLRLINSSSTTHKKNLEKNIKGISNEDLIVFLILNMYSSKNNRKDHLNLICQEFFERNLSFK